MTNENAIPGSERSNWTKRKEKLKATFANLTDTDLEYIEGNTEEMLVRIQNKTGKSKEELFKIMASL